MTCCGRCRICRPEWEDLERTIEIRTDERSQAIQRAIRAEDRLAEALCLLRAIRDHYHDKTAGGMPGSADAFHDSIAAIDAMLANATKRQGFPEYLKGG